jgi:hypothetical protein
MKSLILILGTAALLLTVGLRVQDAGAVFTNPDPCGGTQPKITVPISVVATAGTTQLVAPLTGTAIYVCSVKVYASTNAATVQFEYGTGAACTGTNALTGAILGPATATPGIPLMSAGTEGSQSQLIVPGAATPNGLCLVAGGTTPSLQGWLDYVQG